jgi:monomeric isocitrate dehydrogenase
MDLRNKLIEINLLRKIGSLIFAIITYVIIYNIYDPIITVKIENVAVQIQNEDAITKLGKVYSIKENGFIDIYVKGKNSLVKDISNKDIKAIADLQNLSITNSVSINVEIPKLKNENIDISFEQNDTLHL